MATANEVTQVPEALEEYVNTVVDGEASVAPPRFFTIAGRDPFDEVEWELRHALIPGKDGPAFDQKDVEFPRFWSQTATNIVAQKYFRGRMSSPERERSVKQMIGRIVGTIGAWGRQGGYFATGEEVETFEAELKAILVNQIASFNSPVWFNVGFEEKPQASACFILSIEDSMDSILDWIRREGVIFRGGSGSGINLSRLRSSKEQLSKGGYASGPVSFMRGADASAGTIKSGGKTRRAAKMVVLDVDHPDVDEFIWCKAKEERKARVLEQAGYDMSLDSPDWASIQYQNANNSVRVTDAFMEAVVEGKEWNLTARTDGSVVETVDARKLLKDIAEASWQCADPGVQYDTTINKWHTSPNTGRINASNPCFPGDARVHTTLGLITFEELYELAEQGEEIRVYTHRATAEEPGDGVVATVPLAVMRNGIKPVVRLRFANGQELRCTPNHRIWTLNRGYVPAEELAGEDVVLLNDSPTPAEDAAWALPVGVEAVAVSRSRGGTTVRRELPDRWSEGLGELLGHVVGDGWLTDVQTGWVYGGDDIEDGLCGSHEGMLRELIGGISRQVMQNGTVQLRAGSEGVRTFFRLLGVSSALAPDKRVPQSVFFAPPEVQAAFLRGLFGADGCVSRVENGKASRYAGLGSRSEALLKDVQRLLNTFGIRGRIYQLGGQRSAFAYTRVDGTEVTYTSSEGGLDLRITGSDLERFAEVIGFSAPRKQVALEAMLAGTTRYATKQGTSLVSREDDGQEVVYNLSEPLHHSYIVDGVLVANCSEYMHIDDSACNLSSLNLMKFRKEDGEFDVPMFEQAVDVMFLAQEIIVGYSSYPTPEIGRNALRFRQLGLGYANLGALLMARGLPYDSDEGRAYAAAITAIMTGRAYRKSAEVAKRMAPHAGYAENAAAMLGVISKHRAAVGNIQHTDSVPAEMLSAARKAWDDALDIGEAAGFRNAQATVLAPTGCLVGDSLVSTSRGLVRLRSLGDTVGQKWQDLDIEVSTDEGPRQATGFYVNGFEQVVSIETGRGYRIQGTPTHRIKVVDRDGAWVWRRFAEIAAGDRVPLQLNGMVGEPQHVQLPPLGELYWTSDQRTHVPESVTPELAELVGYFMGDGSLHAKGLRFCVAAEDRDVVARLVDLGRTLFSLDAHTAEKKGYVEVAFHSVPLALWWQASGFAKLPPAADHRGKGWVAHIPDAILHTNDREVYAAFVRGLFEADGTTNNGYVSWSTVSESFSRDVQSLLLALGFVTTRNAVTTRDVNDASSNWGDHERFVLRLLNVSSADRWLDEVWFISERKPSRLASGDHRQAARHDHIPVGRGLIDELAPENDALRKTMLMALARRGDVSRRAATALLERSASPELEHMLGYYYDTVATIETLEDEPTFDLSVPDNVTYVANGFISHNTISFMMDCDTTGVEPDFSLVKSKKLVGGGEITIVNKTVPMALAELGYAPGEVEEIVAYIDERNTIVGAPHVKGEHFPVFDCAIGDRAIHYMGHVKMMGAIQPFISGALSKTVNLPEQTSVDEVAQLLIEAWQLGVKAIAIYRDNCKVAQPLSGSKDRSEAGIAAQIVALGGVVAHPKRRRLPDDRVEVGRKFRVGEYEGYIHVGLFDDGTPGDIFVDIAKEGTTLAGLMNSFMISVSLGLQYGVPLEVYVSKFSHMRFEPSGMTNDADIRIAKSLVDYIFRWMGKKFLTSDQQEEAGILTPEVKARLAAAYAAGEAAPAAHEAPPTGQTALFNSWEDAVECSKCGGRMVRTGSCYTCRDCGTNTGCS
jgi:ribonucleoside-diphosphate reductase alpha chain